MTESTTPNRPIRNTLNKLNNYHLFAWVSSKRDWVEKCSLNQDQIANQAAKDLGFRVTRANLKEVCLALGVALPNKRGASTAPDLRQKLEAMDQRLLDMDQRLQQTEQLLNEALKVQGEQGRVVAKLEGQLAALQIPLTPLKGPAKDAPKLI